MIETLKKLIEALRDELKNYGQMLVLLERQHKHVITRSADEVSHSTNLIQEQGAVLIEARALREKCRRAVAEAAGQYENTSFAELLPLVPLVYQPLLKALVDENNELLILVRRQARQNHLTLRRSIELMQEVMNSLCPQDRAPDADNRTESHSRSRAIQRLHEELN